MLSECKPTIAYTKSTADALTTVHGWHKKKHKERRSSKAAMNNNLGKEKQTIINIPRSYYYIQESSLCKIGNMVHILYPASHTKNCNIL